MAVSGSGGKPGLASHPAPHLAKTVVAVAGPTCSGKSALALALADRLGGAIINADSMQIYRELRILTARPSAAEEQAVPHRLYGIRAASDPGSVAWWAGAATAAIGAAHDAGLVPILCGGTGLYFSALTDGLAAVPDPGEQARTEARALLRVHGPEALHQALMQADPRTATGLRPSDGQRVARAWEVFRGTGKGLAEWQDLQVPPEHGWAWHAVILDPPRAALRAAIASRFDAMLRAGALEEVGALLLQNLDPALPAMRAHGVPELAAVLRGTLALGEAARLAILATGQYTKRQATWFRHRHIAAEANTHRLNARITAGTQFSDFVNPIMANILSCAS